MLTFLLTDVEGSTRLWEQDPDGMSAELARHDALVGEAVARNAGTVIKARGEGDSIFAVFTRATDALAAAVDAQRALLSGSSLRVRMAVHSGETIEREDDYYGPAVNRCARLRAAAHGSQILLTQVTAELVRDHDVDGVELRDLGYHALRDLIRPERIHQVVHPDLPDAFPPPRSLDVFNHNLPRQTSALVGREPEIASAKELLLERGVRLVTLTGPGGIGKTRLALQIGADIVDAYADGVWFVPLASITDHTLVASQIASTLGAGETGGRPIADAVRDFLWQKRTLLVLDNFEHVVDAAGLVAGLLTSCPNLAVLVTSRERLAITGEHEIAVPPLALPDPARTPPADVLSQYEAVQLFIDRALAVQPAFAVTNENAPAIAEICHRLDGLPLALELAAARTRVLAPKALLDGLDERLPQLAGPRDAPARHRTLWAAIAWSYDLLSEHERTLLRRMSVFAGGASLEAIADVCGEPDPIDILASLVDRSMLRQAEQPDGESRFWMLETIRRFAAERLDEDDDGSEVRERHNAWFAALAAEAEPELQGPNQSAWLMRLEREHHNLRAVLDRCGKDSAIGMAGSLSLFWDIRGHLTEGRRRLDEMLAGTSARTYQRARALVGAGELAFTQGDLDAAAALFDQAVDLARDLGHDVGLASALSHSAEICSIQGDIDGARSAAQEALDVARRAANPSRVAYALANLAGIAYTAGRYAEAGALYEDSLAIRRQLGEVWAIANTLVSLAGVAFSLADEERARGLLDESLAMMKKLGNRSGVSLVLGNMARLAHMRGDTSEAIRLTEDSLEIGRDLGDRRSVCRDVLNLGLLARERGDLLVSRSQLEEAVSVARDISYVEILSIGLNELARIDRLQGNLESARNVLEESLGIARRSDDRRTLPRGLVELGRVERDLGNTEAARTSLREAVELFREVGHPVQLCEALIVLAGVSDAPTSLLEEALEIARSNGDPTSVGAALMGLADVARLDGDLGRARTLHREGLGLRRNTGDTMGIIRGVEALAALDPDVHRRVRLYAAANAARERAPCAVPADITRSVQELRSSMDPAAFTSTWMAGRALSLDAAVEEALAESASPLEPAPAVAPYIFRREGDYWTIAYEGHAIRLKDTSGLRYVAELLRHQGREISVLDLDAAVRGHEPQAESDAGPAIDAQARRAYGRRLAELEEERQEAESFNDIERASRLREEIDTLAAELARAVGLGGRDRRQGSAAERARVNVTKVVKATVRRITSEHPALGAHLDEHLRTGRFCRYAPDERVDWDL